MESRKTVNLEERISQNISDVKFWAKLLNYVHYTLLFGAAILNTIAAVVLQFKATGSEALQRNSASILSAIAALMGVIAASGGYERKWRAFRWTLHRLRELELDLTPENIDSEQIKERYKTIWRDHEMEIAGTGK
jgi:hypothetical protein